MEIKLNQSEIEEAVRDRLNRIFALASDSNFAIDFQATRGPEGFIATISINPPKPDEPKAELVDEPIPVATTEAKPQTTASKPKRLVLDQKAKEPEAVVQTVAEPVVETVAQTVKEPDPVVDTEGDKPPFNEGDAVSEGQPGFKGFAKDEAVADPVQEEVVAEAKPVRTSLFGGLGKPSNS